MTTDSVEVNQEIKVDTKKTGASSGASLSICLTAYHFPIMGRASDQGFLWLVAKGLAKSGHSVTVIAAKSPLGKAEILRDGVRVFYLHEGSPNKAHIKFEDAVYQKFKELHRQNRFDIVHSIDQSARRIGQFKKRLGVCVTFDVEATQMSQLFSILGMGQDSLASLIQTGIAVAYKYLTTYFGRDRKILNLADAVFVSSPTQKNFLERYYFYPDRRTYLVPYGIELGDLQKRGDLEEVRKKLKIPDGKSVALTISDMTEAQELKYLLKAFERVAVKKPDAIMVIIGNGPAWSEVEFHLFSYALGNRVFMVGALSPEEISEYVAITDVFIAMSSRSTGFEPAMLEAMAQAKVIIGSEVSPMSNILEDGVDGFLLRPADIDSLSHLLMELFSGSMPSAEIGLRAQAKVLKMFDSKLMVQALEGAYVEIIKNNLHRNRQKSV